MVMQMRQLYVSIEPDNNYISGTLINESLQSFLTRNEDKMFIPLV